MSAKKLFAMENISEEGVVDTEDMVTPEEGEAADIGAEVSTDAQDIDESAAATDEGIGAADSLEEVQEVVESSLDTAEGDGEGLTEVAAEAIAIAIKAICARVGANPKRVYSLYATENFRSPSSRRANTTYAMEGIGEFLKDLWEKIKASITTLWEKIKAFWNKHISSLGRMVKALESMKTKISNTKGSPNFETVDAPSSLKAIFPSTSGMLGTKELDQYFANLAKAADANSKAAKVFTAFDDNVSDAITLMVTAKKIAGELGGSSGMVIELGTEKDPLPGGKYFKWTMKMESQGSTGDDTEIFKLEVDEDHGDFTDGEKDVKLDNVGKEKLKTIITNTLTLAKSLVKYRDQADKRAKAISDNMNKISKKLDSDTIKPENVKAVKNAMRTFSLLMAKRATVENKVSVASMAFMRGVVIFTAACLKQIKKA